MALEEHRLDHAAFNLWLMAEGENNRAELDRVKRILPIVLDECCTVMQKTYIMHYYVDQMPQTEIAERYGVDASTVNKTIHRGLDNAYNTLRFVSPLFIKMPSRRRVLRKEGCREKV